MDLYTLRQVFMWCVILNGGVLLAWSALMFFAPDFVYRIHYRWFPFPRETFDAVMYGGLGFFRMFYFMFVVIPFIALLLAG